MVSLKVILIVNIYILWKSSLALNDVDGLTVDYFVFKGVKHVCLFETSGIRITLKPDIFFSAYLLSISKEGINHTRSDKLKKCLRTYKYPIGVRLNANFCNYQDIMKNLSEQMVFDANHYWLIFIDPDKYIDIPTNETNNLMGDSPNFPMQFKAFMENMTLSIDAEITVALRKKYNTFELYEFFNFGKTRGGSLLISLLGLWSIQSGIIINANEQKYIKRWNFQNLTLRAVSVVAIDNQTEFTPKLLTDSYYTPGVTGLTKISSIILDILRQMHNFRLNITIVDRWIGAIEKNSTPAVTNLLYHKYQDISSTSIRMFPNWLSRIDYLIPSTTTIETKFYYIIPETGVGVYQNEFLRPFSSTTWITVFVVCLFCSGIIFLSASAERNIEPTQFALFSVWAALCQQGFNVGQTSVNNIQYTIQAKKIAIIATTVSTMLLYNFYTSSVVSWLLSAPPPTISSLEELIASPLEVIFEDIGYARSWLEVPDYYFTSTKKILEDMLKTKKVKIKHRSLPLMQSVSVGIESVRKGGYAYHTEPYNANRWILKTFNQEEICKLGSLEMIETVKLYMVAQKHSPYKEFFKWSLMRASERGHFSWARQRVMGVEPKCDSTLPRALSLGGAAPTFLFLVCGGWLAGSMILLFEITLHRWSQRSNAS